MTLGLYVSHAHFLDAAHLFPDVVKPWVFGSPPTHYGGQSTLSIPFLAPAMGQLCVNTAITQLPRDPLVKESRLWAHPQPTTQPRARHKESAP